ncbi:MAG: DUF6605 domain-containing protein [Candidatus Eisenbacteria bacterium]
MQAPGTPFGRWWGVVCAVLVLAPPVFAGPLLYVEDFSHVNARTGLPQGWGLGPRAHIPYFSTAADSQTFGAASPSIRVDVPLHTLNYRIDSPNFRLPRMDQDYTLEFALQVNQPDSPFRVEMVYMDLDTHWYRLERVLSLVGESMDSLRVFRIPFNPGVGPDPGRVWIAFGLPYSKVLREGSFRLDDVRIRQGADIGRLAFYLGQESVDPGSSVDLHVSTRAGTATVEVFHETDRARRVYGPIAITGLREEPVPDESWRNGCGWTVSASIPVGRDWPSGVYTVKIDDGNQRVWDTFSVRGDGTEGKLLVVLPTYTDQAYNQFGGGSFYSDPQRHEVSFERPDDHGYFGFYHVPVHLIRWLHRNGIGYAVASDDDLHARPDLLSAYPGLVLTWHSEYWTGEMRDNVEGYIANGGSVLCLSGNTCWWQSRLVEADDSIEPGSTRRLVCYKYTAASDPYWSIDRGRVTTHWDDPPLDEPTNRFLGLSWRTGGGINFSTLSSCPCEYDWLDGYGGYEVFHIDHWVFDGTGFRDGDTCGQAYAILGHEVDGAPLEWVDGQPMIRPEGGTPPGFEVLGYSPCWSDYEDDHEGIALMAIEDRGSSFVFNGGTTGWCWGMKADAGVQQIVRNLIDRIPDRFQGWDLPVIEASPNPSASRVFLRVLGPGIERRLEFYDTSGRRVGTSDLREGVTNEGVPFGTTTWDFRDGNGRAVPPGVYFVRGGAGATARVVHVR